MTRSSLPLLCALSLLASACSEAAPPPPVSPPPPTPVAPPAATASAAAPTSAKAGPPVAPIREVRDTYFGTTIVDPYRWMETPGPEFSAWLKGQADFTRATLDQIPALPKLLARIKELDNAVTQVSGVQIWGGKTFYLKAQPGEDNRKLYVREGAAGAERLLLDPERLTEGGKHFSIDWFAPSPDGSRVAYGLSPSGSENSVLHVLETASGKALADSIDRAQFDGVSWMPDGRSFFYTRLQKTAPDAPATAKYQRARAYLHALGSNPEEEKAVLGYGVSSAAPFKEDEVATVVVPPGSDYVIGLSGYGVRNEQTAYVAKRASVAGEKTPWKKLLDADADEVTAFDVQGSDIYLLTHHGAPRFKVLRVSLAKPDVAHAATLVPESGLVLQSIGVAKDGLYVQALDGGIGRLQRAPLKGGAVETIPLPVEGTLVLSFTHPSQPGALVRLTSWTLSPRYSAYDPKQKKLEDTKLLPPSPIDFSSITSEEVKAKSADGTLVPLSIVYRRDLVRDGSHPTWLDGYGAYAVTNDPSFVPARLAWLERGGVFATCHVRGGGEYGEEWHRGGMMGTKQHTIDDFLGCAQYLIDQKLTSPARLGGEGTSAGGLLINGAITQRPDLFGAAIVRVAYANALRLEAMPAGPLNVPEFGTVKTEEGWKGLLAMDAYTHVKDGTRFPAVLLTTGATDPRVEPWQPAKMTARLQAATSSGKPVLLRVDYDAGHGLGSTRSQRDAELADEYAFLLQQLGAL